MKKIRLQGLLMLVVSLNCIRAQTIVPVTSQAEGIVLTGATAHLGNGKIIYNSVIGFRNGKLAIAAEASDNIDISEFKEINISGQHIYPGLILPNSQLGLMDVSAVRAMNDFSERGELNPNVRSLVAYNTDSDLIPTMRFNGILLAEIAPAGGLISGTSSVMEMAGWDWEDAAHSVDIAVHLNWPLLTIRQLDFEAMTWKVIPNKDYEKQTSTLARFFTEAKEYPVLREKEKNLKMEAMQDIFTGAKPLLIHADDPKEIIQAVLFARRFEVQRIVIVSGQGALPVAAFLKEHNIPVILPSTHVLPERADDDIDMPYKLPHLLTQAGVMVCLAAEDRGSGARNLAFYAGTACAYGMDKEEALKTITSNTAKALGVDQRVGTLEVGKDATLFVSVGDVLDYRSSKVQMAFISGKLVALPDKQEALFDQYSKKYGHKE